jgi:hypothetical protein
MSDADVELAPVDYLVVAFPAEKANFAYIVSFLTIGGGRSRTPRWPSGSPGQIRSWHLRHIPGARRRITPIE